MPTGRMGRSRWTLGKTHLPCSTSPMVVPEAAVDIVAGAVVCLPTVSTRLETRRGRGADTDGVGQGEEREETKEAEED